MLMRVMMALPGPYLLEGCERNPNLSMPWAINNHNLLEGHRLILPGSAL